MSVALSCWRTSPQTLSLSRGQIHLWRFPLNLPLSTVKSLQDYLSADELARANKLIIPEKRYQFVVARATLRKLLGRYLDKSSCSLSFSYGPEGKPTLLNEQKTVTFNLAHSGSWGLLAVTKSGEIGVDVESIDRSVDFLKLAEQYFSGQELNALLAAREQRQRRTFYRLWTLKESRLKCLGSGFSAMLDPPANPDLLHFKSFIVAKNYLGSLCSSAGITSISRFQVAEK